MKRKSSPRLRAIRLAITYFVMIVAIVVIVTVLVFVLLGYQLSGDGRLTQGGLVQFGSNPGSATVYIDGVKFGSTTPTQTTLLSGSHSFQYQKQGYRPWQKTLSLMPGSVLWVNYARLVPTTLTPKTVANFDTVASALASPNNGIMAIVPDASQPKVVLGNITGDQVKTVDVTLPEGSFTAPTQPGDQTFSIASWSADSHYLLLKHTYNGNSVEWLRLDATSPATTTAIQNITTELAVPLNTLVFRPSNSSQLYALSDSADLRLIDLSNQTISAPLATDVANYYVAPDDGMVTYVTNTDAKTNSRSVGYISDGSTKSQVLRTYTDDGNVTLHAVSGVYYNQRYIAISHGDQLVVMSADLPDSGSADTSSLSLQVIKTETLPFATVDTLSDITRGRFVVASNSTTYTTYDLELGRYTTATFSGSLDVRAAARPFGWLDNYVLYSVTGGELQLAEFDGGNHQSIVQAIPGLDETLSPNGKYLYEFMTTTDGKVALTRVQMILN